RSSPAMDSDTIKKVTVYKAVGYGSVVVSAVAVLSIWVTIPMLYQQASHLRRSAIHDLGACRSHAKGVWSDLIAIPALPTHNRTARQAYW
ncbi:hypothetical protein PENTCL1PPCAC_5515, partial [Pristionchus entomophagus]